MRDMSHQAVRETRPRGGPRAADLRALRRDQPGVVLLFPTGDIVQAFGPDVAPIKRILGEFCCPFLDTSDGCYFADRHIDRVLKDLVNAHFRVALVTHEPKGEGT